jgi:hypothetical protein
MEGNDARRFLRNEPTETREDALMEGNDARRFLRNEPTETREDAPNRRPRQCDERTQRRQFLRNEPTAGSKNRHNRQWPMAHSRTRLRREFTLFAKAADVRFADDPHDRRLFRVADHFTTPVWPR